MTRPLRRVLEVGLPAVVLVVILATVAGTVQNARTDGPLRASSPVSVEFPLRPGQPATWGMTLPTNPTIADIRVESVEPVGVDGLKVLGVLVSHPARDGSLVNALGFPPHGIVTSPVENSLLPALGSPMPELQALVGVALEPGHDSGAIDAIRVRYVAVGERYEAVFPWSLRITLAQ
jgi:hypothetical protein